VSQAGSDITLWARCPQVTVTVKPLSPCCLSAASPAISCAGNGWAGREGRGERALSVCFGFGCRRQQKEPRGHPSPRRRAEENEKKQAETGGSV